MQPQSDKSIIDRVREWWRGLTGQSDANQRASTDAAQQDRQDPAPASDTADATVADAASRGEQQVSGTTGASVDEFAAGGYAGEPTSPEAVEAAADDPDSESEAAGIGLDPERAYSPFATDADSDSAALDNGDAASFRTSSGTTVGDLGVSDAGDLDAGELGSLEEFDGQDTEFDGDASVSSATDFADDESGSLRDLGHEASDYTTSATDDLGMRTVDEDDPGVTMGQETESDFGTDAPEDIGVNSGSDVETSDADSLQEIENEVTDYAVEGASVAGAERPGDAIDSAALSDAEFETPGVPDEFVGSAANLDLESTADVDPEPAETTEEQGATGELGATEFGGEIAGEGDEADVQDDEYLGLFGTSDIDTADLTYLDDSDERRFDFSAESTTDSAEERTEIEGPEPTVGDDIGASPTGVMDDGGTVPAETDGGFLTDASGGDSGDFDSSTTGASSEATSGAVAASGASVAAAATGIRGEGRTRGDEDGGCPEDFPIKGNASSKIYHLPDIPSYQGTKAGWCFATEADAVAAGYRAPAGHRNRAAGGAEAGPAAATATKPSLEEGGDTFASDEARAIETEPEPTSTTQHSEPAGDEQPAATMAIDSDDEFGSGDDDIESLQHQSPDDVASEYADASAEGGDRLTAGAEVAAAFESQADVDSQFTTDDSSGATGESLYAGSVKGDGTKTCPVGYPIKGNGGSMIYHAPGRASYQATIPEWCFATEEDAANAGFRPPKR